jgi:predicted nucleic acid-binding protein
VSDLFVLDSFAVLALLGREPGSEDVAKLLRRAQKKEARVLMTWVNAGEVAYILERRFGVGPLHTALAVMEATALEIVPVERELALMAAHIKAGYAIAYANAFAAALAQQVAATLVTGDPEFRLLEEVLDILWLPQREP